MWHSEIARGGAGAFHAREIPDPLEPTVWWFDVASPSLVLGSSQPIEHIDVDACTARGIEVVRRRSGGGAVLLQPGDVTWVDVLIPRGHAQWSEDVGQAAWWLGECWRSALYTLGVMDTHVHRGPMVRTQWSDRVCFAGVGGGELMRDGAKVVGISQRRTRLGARFQCAVYHAWRPQAHSGLFSPPAPTPGDLEGLVVAVEASPADVRTALESVLHHL